MEPFSACLALELQRLQDIVDEPVRQRLALDPREREQVQVRTEELARALVIELLAPRDLCGRASHHGWHS